MRPTLVRDARDATAAPDLGPLPDWDLSDLYAGDDAPELARDLEWLDAECATFARDYEGKLADARRRGPAGRDPPLRAHRDGRRPDHVLRRPALLPEHDGHRPGQVHGRHAGPHHRPSTTPLVFFTLEFNRLDDAHLDAPAGRRTPTSPATSPSSTACARCGPTSCRTSWRSSCTTSRSSAPPPGTGCSTRRWPGLMFEVDGRGRGAEPRSHAEPADRPRPRPARGRRPQALAEVFERAHQAVRPRPQHAGQGKGNRGPLAQDADAADRPAPVEPRRARGGRGAAQRRGRGLSEAVAPLLPAQGEMDGAGQAAGLGPQRAPADRDAARSSTGTRRAPPCSTPTPAFDPRMADLAQPFFDKGWIDAGVKPGKAPGAFAHPTVTDRASLRHAELPRQTARRDDAGA